MEIAEIIILTDYGFFPLLDQAFSFDNLTKTLFIIFMLFISALISAAEVGFFSLSPADINKIKLSQNRQDGLIIELLDNPKKLLATLLIVINLINVSIIIISSFVRVFDYSHHPVIGFFIQVVVVTFIIVLFAEVIPKVYATKHNITVARFMALPIYLFTKIFSPISYVMIASTGIIDRRVQKRAYEVNIDELTHAIDITSDVNTPEQEKKILKGIVKLSHIDVKQIMRSRLDTIGFDITTPFDVLLEAILKAGYSRIPVFKDNFDNMQGIIYVKDLLAHLDAKPDFRWQQLIRPPFFVPESKKCNDLLKEFQHKKIHLAIVVDEFGGCSGIVTLEDILEEIVGEINDEFDDEELIYSKLDETNYVFEGKIPLNDICRITGLDRKVFETSEGDTGTLAGLILELEGEIPEKNKVIEFNRFRFTIESADKRKIKRVKLTILDPTEELSDEFSN